MNGQYIKKYRKTNKITQAQLAEDIGKTQTDVSRMEAGRDPIGEDVLEVMIKAGIVPDMPDSASESIKNMVHLMNHEDKALMLQFAARMLG